MGQYDIEQFLKNNSDKKFTYDEIAEGVGIKRPNAVIGVAKISKGCDNIKRHYELKKVAHTKTRIVRLQWVENYGKDE
jgi:hypothetical protein